MGDIYGPVVHKKDVNKNNKCQKEKWHNTDTNYY